MKRPFSGLGTPRQRRLLRVPETPSRTRRFWVSGTPSGGPFSGSPAPVGRPSKSVISDLRMDRFGLENSPFSGSQMASRTGFTGLRRRRFGCHNSPSKHPISGVSDGLRTLSGGCCEGFERPRKPAKKALAGPDLGSKRVSNITRPTFLVFLDFLPADRVSRARLPRGILVCASWTYGLRGRF